MLTVFLRWLGTESGFRITAGIVGLVALIALCGLVRGCIIDDHDAKREATASEAREESVEALASDMAIAAEHQKELTDAIDAAPPGGTTSPAQHALDCARLRKLGRIPLACAAPSGD